MAKIKIYYKIDSEKKQGSGRQQKVSIFKISNKNLVELGKITWNTASYLGAKHEVYAFLFKNKIVSKKEYTANKKIYRAIDSKVVIEEI